MQRHPTVNTVRGPSIPKDIPGRSTARNAIIALIIFFTAHFALLVGVTTPEKFVFDEVHYVPAARQMLEPGMPEPILNPMHPPLAKQLIALSIRTFGDGPLGWRYPAVLFGSLHFVAGFVLIPAIVYLATFVPLYGLSFWDILEAQRRIFGDNTTTAIAGHTYMSAWPSWPFLVRPVWYLFDKIADDRIAAVVFLGNPLVLWPALPALVVCLRDWIVTRRGEAFLVLSFYFGPYLAWALLPRTLCFLYYYF